MKRSGVALGALWLVSSGAWSARAEVVGDEMRGEPADATSPQESYERPLDDPRDGASDWSQGRTEQPIGFYSEGRLVNADRFENEGAGYVKIFRPREHGWAAFDLIAVVTHGAARLARLYPSGERLQIADASARAGGQLSSHASHQVGLDVDLVYFRRNHREMDPVAPTALDELFVQNGKVTKNFDTARNWEFIKSLVSTRRVNRIFVDPRIKKALCVYARQTGEFSEGSEPLRRLRPYDNHMNHMHLRVTCPLRSPRCVKQKEPPPGSGCSNLRVARGRSDG